MIITDNAIDKLEQLSKTNTELINVSKGVSYPFVYVEGITNLEISAFRKFFANHPGNIPVMVKMENSFAKIGETQISLALYLELSKYSSRKIYIKKSKSNVVEFESILPHLLLERV